MRKKNESDCQRSYSLSLSLSLFFVWAQLGSNQRPPDYESGAANHLSYGPEKVFQSAGSFALCGQRPSRSASRRIRDAANHLSYGPEITGCKYNIKLNYLQTKIFPGGSEKEGEGCSVCILQFLLVYDQPHQWWLSGRTADCRLDGWVGGACILQFLLLYL